MCLLVAQRCKRGAGQGPQQPRHRFDDRRYDTSCGEVSEQVQGADTQAAHHDIAHYIGARR